MREKTRMSRPSLEDAVLLNEHEIASLWSGYGQILRQQYRLQNRQILRAIKKQVFAPTIVESADADESHIRKMKSYIVERYFYRHLADDLVSAHVPITYSVQEESFIMEDLTLTYPIEHDIMSLDLSKVVLSWLADFHASFWTPKARQAAVVETGPCASRPVQHGVWEEGGYWVLRTRMEEFKSLTPEWKLMARKIDAEIRALPDFLTSLIHGDCKSANMMFSEDSQKCALLDFQYIGRGPAVRDVIYFFTSSVQGLATHETELLEYYHHALQDSLKRRGDEETAARYTFDVMMDHYELCLLDYYRFMLGWVMLAQNVMQHAANFMVRACGVIRAG